MGFKHRRDLSVNSHLIKVVKGTTERDALPSTILSCKGKLWKHEVKYYFWILESE